MQRFWSLKQTWPPPPTPLPLSRSRQSISSCGLPWGQNMSRCHQRLLSSRRGERMSPWGRPERGHPRTERTYPSRLIKGDWHPRPNADRYDYLIWTIGPAPTGVLIGVQVWQAIMVLIEIMGHMIMGHMIMGHMIIGHMIIGHIMSGLMKKEMIFLHFLGHIILSNSN